MALAMLNFTGWHLVVLQYSVAYNCALSCKVALSGIVQLTLNHNTLLCHFWWSSGTAEGTLISQRKTVSFCGVIGVGFMRPCTQCNWHKNGACRLSTKDWRLRLKGPDSATPINANNGILWHRFIQASLVMLFEGKLGTGWHHVTSCWKSTMKGHC